jgi:hypothetical protein
VLRADLARGLAGIPAGVPPVAGLIHSLCSATTVKLASVDAAVSTRGVA